MRSTLARVLQVVGVAFIVCGAVLAIAFGIAPGFELTTFLTPLLSGALGGLLFLGLSAILENTQAIIDTQYVQQEQARREQMRREEAARNRPQADSNGMIVCGVCGKKYSSDRARCSHCGAQ